MDDDLPIGPLTIGPLPRSETLNPPIAGMTNTPASTNTPKDTGSGGDWPCPVCTFENKSYDDECEMCGSSK
jgi:hypothetical protein